MAKCKICGANVEPFISFGKQPIANNFLKQEEKASPEYFFDLDVAYCSECTMVQLTNQPDREQMFHDNYAFYSSTSNYMKEHFKKFCDQVCEKYIDDNPFVIEMGCNDGIMLQHFKANGVKNLGIEPSGNVAEVAREKGIDVVVEFFDEDLAEKIVTEHGKADAFMSANVMCHIPYLDSIAKGIKKVLKEKGVYIFEDPYLGEILKKTSYDQIYDEHVFLFSAHSVQNAFGRFGLELFHVEPQITHGGSMRYYLSHPGAHEHTEALKNALAQEKERGFLDTKTYESFRDKCEKSKSDLVELLNNLKSDGKKVVGYGATSKSTTVLNYCHIGPEHISFISDTTPVKQGKFTPGVHIPVVPYEEFGKADPDYVVLFAWNHRKEIMEKEKGFKGKWITYIPEVQIFETE